MCTGQADGSRLHRAVAIVRVGLLGCGIKKASVAIPTAATAKIVWTDQEDGGGVGAVCSIEQTAGLIQTHDARQKTNTKVRARSRPSRINNPQLPSLLCH